ncbi:MAG: hypothetical protein HKM28_02030 [Flavobacteriaceae bacterium]|nr:hypothetical protein [Flavobacteriaceae bacterium]
MKSTRYTQIILTVIAACLVINTLQEIKIFPTAHANNEPSLPISNGNYRLIDLADDNVLEVRLVDIATYDELNVNLKGVQTTEEVNVNLKSIDTSDELDVNLDEIGGRWISSGGPLPVTHQ